jgi:predicted RNA-binding protein with RPS1 domain
MYIKAINELILIISLNIKVKLIDIEQNNSYLLLIKLREINTPITN